MKNTKKNKDLKKDQTENLNFNEEGFEINLPEVSDIPGQENIHPPYLGEMADTTIASDDEEGLGLFQNNMPAYSSDLDTEDKYSDLTESQKEALEQTDSEDDKANRKAAVDDVDDDGDILNEKNEEEDLDIPGAQLDDQDEEIGEEDEENNFYSNGDNK